VIYAGSSSKHHDPSDSPYAMTKFLGEEICKLYKKSFNVNVEIARFYNVYGPGEIVDGDWAAVIGKWRQQVRDGEPITIVGNGEQKRDFTHIDDIIDGLWKIGIKDLVHEDAWELGTGRLI
jgi:UDP-glucose 4-epimerase